MTYADKDMKTRPPPMIDPRFPVTNPRLLPLTSQDQPQRSAAGGGVSSQLTNCRTFVDNKLRVAWGSDSQHVYVELSAELAEDDWMGFGLSGDQTRSVADGAARQAALPRTPPVACLRLSCADPLWRHACVTAAGGAAVSVRDALSALLCE